MPNVCVSGGGRGCVFRHLAGDTTCVHRHRDALAIHIPRSRATVACGYGEVIMFHVFFLCFSVNIVQGVLVLLISVYFTVFYFSHYWLF